jgi:hypothetical protein
MSFTIPTFSLKRRVRSFYKGPEGVRRQIDIEPFRILQRSAGDAGV